MKKLLLLLAIGCSTPTPQAPKADPVCRSIDGLEGIAWYCSMGGDTYFCMRSSYGPGYECWKTCADGRAVDGDVGDHPAK